MAEISATYQNDVGFAQGGQQMYIRDTATFKFYNTDFTGEQLRDFLQTTFNGEQIIVNSADGVLSQIGGSSPPVIASGYGFIVFSITDSASNASMRMFSGRVGQEVILVTRGGGSTGSVKIFFSGADAADTLSGVICLGTQGAALSCIDLNNSANSQAYIRLRCFTAGTWCILDQNYNTVTENAAA